jgi:hypothetical protein
LAPFYIFNGFYVGTMCGISWWPGNVLVR